MAVAPNGDIYVALQSRGGRGQPETGGGVVGAARCQRRRQVRSQGADSAAGSTTGIALRNGYLYLAHPTTIERFKMTAGQLKPAGAAETIVTGLPPTSGSTRTRASRSTAAARSTSTSARRRTPVSSRDRQPGVEGSGSVPDSREARRHLEVRREQARIRRRTQGTRFATGLRQMPAITWHDGALYIVMNNRDQLDVVLAGQVHGEGQRRASGRADVSRGAGLELRLAVLLLRLPAEEARC